MRMKALQLILVASNLFLVALMLIPLGVQSELTMQAPAPPSPADILPNTGNDDDARAAITKAASEKRTDLLFSAMRYPSREVQLYCVTCISTLDRTTQAQLLSRILLDGRVVWYKDYSYDGGSEQFEGKAILQCRLLVVAYTLLRDDKALNPSELTRAEAIALAAKLRAVR